jgi:hypothetical protein
VEGIFKLCLGSKTLDMISDGFVEMFEGDFAEKWAKKIHSSQWGDEQTCHAQAESEDPHVQDTGAEMLEYMLLGQLVY